MFLVRDWENKQFLWGKKSRFASRLWKKMKPEFFNLTMMMLTSVQVVVM